MSDVAIFTDGGARGNPGPAGAGAVVYKGKKKIAEVSEFLGTRTNNWAEYEALILALETARKTLGLPAQAGKKISDVTVKMDSELIVKQMKGEYKVKHPELKAQHQHARRLIEESFPHISFTHIPREKNYEADQLANDAMDRGS